jgi:hypothetical protein
MRHQYDNKKMILNEARRQECRYVKKPLHHGTILSLAVLLLLVSRRRLLRFDIHHDSKSLHQGQGASSKLERRQYGSRIASCQTTAPVKPSQRRRRERERSQRNNSNSTVWEYSSSPSAIKTTDACRGYWFGFPADATCLARRSGSKSARRT